MEVVRFETFGILAEIAWMETDTYAPYEETDIGLPRILADEKRVMDLRSSATQRETATHDNKRTRVSISRSCQMLENSQQASRSFNPASKLRSDAIFPAYSYTAALSLSPTRF